jgi:hypothetical protein
VTYPHIGHAAIARRFYCLLGEGEGRIPEGSPSSILKLRDSSRCHHSRICPAHGAETCSHRDGNQGNNRENEHGFMSTTSTIGTSCRKRSLASSRYSLPAH